MPANISSTPSETLAEIFRLLGQPIRIQILLTIGDQEVCVCHLEAVLALRQAVISQHLMVLRKSGLVAARRNGRFNYYRLVHPSLLDSILQISAQAGLPVEELISLGQKTVAGCHCPRCNPAQNTSHACR
ncbi:MAG: ArsR/SmtB family transcription factor [Anaerolineaceae bacterium]